MKTLAATIGCVICGWGLTLTWADTAADVTAAVQAIQQAPDPSAAVSAYASGFAADRNNIALHNAYVLRMVDFGLPELAYHQAQMLTSLDARNGLAWGVVAHVDARRTDMPGAISAITLAAQSAPEHPFVERTAGEIVAWYDAKGVQANLPDTSRAGIARVRSIMANRPPFTDAYNAARKAYAQQPNGGEPSAAAPPPPDDVPYAYGPPPYYGADFYSDWGPGWVDVWPWYWWWPGGCFCGCNFFPCSSAFAFGCFHDHHWNGTWHNGTWFHDPAGRTGFFGSRTTPNIAVTSSARASFAGRSAIDPVAGSFRGAASASTGAGRGASFASRTTITSGGNTATFHGRDITIPWHSSGASVSARANTGAAPAHGRWSEAGGRSYSSAPAPNYHATYAAPAPPPVSYSSGGGRSFQAPASSFHSSGGGGGWHGGGGGGFHGGGGGGFHGGGGGGHGGGGHR